MSSRNQTRALVVKTWDHRREGRHQGCGQRMRRGYFSDGRLKHATSTSSYFVYEFVLGSWSLNRSIFKIKINTCVLQLPGRNSNQILHKFYFYPGKNDYLVWNPHTRALEEIIRIYLPPFNSIMCCTDFLLNIRFQFNWSNHMFCWNTWEIWEPVIFVPSSSSNSSR